MGQFADFKTQEMCSKHISYLIYNNNKRTIFKVTSSFYIGNEKQDTTRSQ